MVEPLPKKAILVVNAASRRGAEAFEEACERLGETPIELVDANAVEDPSRLDDAVKSAIKRAPMVIVGGGDGTLSSTIDHFVGTDTVFALLPLGTANSFAKTLGLCDDLDEAIEAITNGRRKRIDLGRIDGDYFANVSAIGMSPLIADTVPDGLKKWLGKLGYVVWACRVAARFRPFRMKLELDDGTCITKWTTEIRIANGRYHGGVELVEDANLQSGDIVIQAVTGKSVAHLAWSWFATLFRLTAREQTIEEWRGRRMTLDTRPHQKISIDGEIAAKTPVKVEVSRGAVEVAAPLEPST